MRDSADGAATDTEKKLCAAQACEIAYFLPSI